VAGIGKDNRSYLSTKAERMGHKLSQDELQS
jgi:GTP cyclohydrolase II